MRNVPLSTDVFASIWAARQPGENSEDDILARLLNVRRAAGPQKAQANSAPSRVGFSDPRFGIELPEGFEIFRIYLGKEYRAKAKHGKWELEGTGQSFPSLNQLSRGIGAGTENAWQNWYYAGADGKRVHVSSLRNK